MKKIIAFGLSSLALIGCTFAQSTGSFEATYARLIDQITVQTPTLSTGNALTLSGSSSMNIAINAGATGSGSLGMTIDYMTIGSTTTRGNTTEMKININTLLNGTLEGEKIDNLGLTVGGEIRMTSSMLYLRLESFTLDTNKLPTELQMLAAIFLPQIQSAKGKWIRIRLPKEFATISKDSLAALNPQIIIALLKQYPIVKNIGYANNIYQLQIDEVNLAKFSDQMESMNGKIQTTSPETLQEMKDTFEQGGFKGTLTDAQSPVLTITSQTGASTAEIQGTLIISANKGSFSLSGRSETDGNGSLEASIEKTSPSRYDYMMSMILNSNDITDPFSLLFNIKGYQEQSIVSDYKFIRPLRSMTMRQFEKYAEESMVLPNIDSDSYLQSLTGEALERLNDAQQQAKDTARIADSNQVSIALQIYNADHNRYPVSKKMISTKFLKRYLVPEYIKEIPNGIDNDNEYQYKTIRKNNKANQGTLIITPINTLSRANYFGNKSDFDNKTFEQIEEMIANSIPSEGKKGWYVLIDGVYEYQSNTISSETSDTKILTPEQIKTIKTNAYIDGAKDARILIVEYTDPECPYCIRHHKDNTINIAMGSDKENIAHIMKPVQGVNHPGTEFKSLALLCAGKLKGQEAYYQMFNDIMSLSSLEVVATDSQTTAIAEKIGIQKTDLENCMADTTIKSLYVANRAEAQGFEQSGTPGHLIINTENGKYKTIEGAYPFIDFISAITDIK